MRDALESLATVAPATPDETRRIMGTRKREYIRQHYDALRAVESRVLDLMRRPDYANLRPKLIVIGKHDRAVWHYMRAIISSAPTPNRPGRGIFGLCIDENSGGLLGLFELGGDLMMLGPRDRYIGWSAHRKFRQRALRYVVNLGTCVCVAPFGRLTGGKFIAECVLSAEITAWWEGRYADPIAAICTTSLYGKSSQYNRLPHYQYLGVTPGGGYFHLSPAFIRQLKRFERENRASRPTTASGIGGHYAGTWDLLLHACQELDVDFASVGSKQPRGVYFAPRSPDSVEWLRGDVETFTPDVGSMSEVASWWLDRWYAMRWPKFRNEVADFDFDVYRVHQQMEALTEDA